jgi:hypothetical protein
VAGFHVSGVETSGSAARELDNDTRPLTTMGKSNRSRTVAFLCSRHKGTLGTATDNICHTKNQAYCRTNFN